MQATTSLPHSTKSFSFPKVGLQFGELWLVGLHMGIAFTALSIGLILGPFQSFRRAPAMQWEIPIFTYYYQALTLHGVLNALVFTTFFIMGISYFVTQRTLQRPLKGQTFAWIALGLMSAGLLLAAYAILTNQANVLYTFYAPMLAHWSFYLGLTLVVVGSWVGAGVVFATYLDWRKEHPGEPVPLAVYALLANFIMWGTATLGVATEILTMLLPMSLGIIQTTDPQVTRILFWFFGHPLVYFWLIPAYVSWYTMLPKQLGVTLFSDTIGRVAFLMIMIFSIPVGVHHLFVDPGVSETAKIFHSFLTFIVAVPSFMTAFNIAATLERGGRKRGSKGALLGLDFFAYLPWGDPVVVAQLCGMILFIIGGITGIMNASFTLNTALHNTAWVVGHFHMTLAGAVFLTYMGITYWLLPQMRGRKLWRPSVATAQVAFWFTGMIIFGAGMGRAGIEGAMRRTDMGAPGAFMSEAWVPWLNLSAIGGMFLLISVVLLFAVLLGTLFFAKKPLEEEVDAPPIITAGINPDDPTPARVLLFFERWGLWLSIIIISNVLMWAPVLMQAMDFVRGYWSIAPGTGLSP